MSPNLKKLIASSLLFCLPLVTGCGKDSNPMAPKAPAPPEYVDVTVTLVRLYAVADGDGIEGAGEFSYRALVNDGPGPLDISGYQVLDTGSSHALGQKKVMRIRKDEYYQIQVKFTATEWDMDILGNVYADTRMDNLTEQRMHTSTSTTAGFNDGERWITLGTGDLQFRLVYTITSKPAV